MIPPGATGPSVETGSRHQGSPTSHRPDRRPDFPSDAIGPAARGHLRMNSGGFAAGVDRSTRRRIIRVAGDGVRRAIASVEGVIERAPTGPIEENGVNVKLTGVRSRSPTTARSARVTKRHTMLAAVIVKPWQSDAPRQLVPPNAHASPAISPAPSSASALTALADPSLVVSAACHDGSRTLAAAPAPDVAGGRIAAVSPSLACPDGSALRDFTWAIAAAPNPAAPTVIAAP